MDESRERPKGYRFPKTVISYAIYLYHRFLLSYRDVQELNLFRHTRTRTPARLRRCNLTHSFGLWTELSLAIS